MCQDVFVNLVVQREARNVAQRYAILLCVKICENVTTTGWKLQQAIEDYVMSKAPGWHKMFSESRTLVGDEQRSGRPSATRTGDKAASVRELFRSERR